MQKLFDRRGRISSARISSLSDDARAEIISKNPKLETLSIPEHLYWIANNLVEYPKVCKGCTNKIKSFHSFGQGYTKNYCSLSCMQQCSETISKKKKTIKTRYGVESIWQVSDILDKRKNTCLAKFGTEHTLAKARDVLLQKYDVAHVSAVPGVIEKRLATVKELFTTEMLCKIGNNFSFNVNEYVSHQQKIKLTCLKCRHKFTDYLNVSVQCPPCSKTGTRSNLEKCLADEFYGYSLSQNKKLRINERNVFPDFYFFENNLIVEADGNYWHAEQQGDKLASFKKQKLYSDAGINSLFFFEDEILNKKDIVLSIINSELNKNIIYDSSECTAVQLTTEESNKFFDDNHIHGAARSSTTFGLSHNARLVGAASIKFGRTGNAKITRLCFARGISVDGGISKLVGVIKAGILCNKLSIHIDKRTCLVSDYIAAGFTTVKFHRPNYWLINKKDYLTRLDRSTDISSETSDRIWDCGYITMEII